MKKVNRKKVAPSKVRSEGADLRTQLSVCDAWAKNLEEHLRSSWRAMEQLLAEDFSADISNDDRRATYKRLVRDVRVNLSAVKKVLPNGAE